MYLGYGSERIQVRNTCRLADDRECVDDGVLFALLLGPVVAAALLHAALTTLASGPDSAVPPGWMIEEPLVFPLTPIRRLAGRPPLHPTDAIRALSALATSRRNLVQLFTLCSFVLLVQLAWSLRLELKLSKAEFDGSTYWLRRGELRRSSSAIGFGFLVTAGCLVVKVVTAYIGRGVWSGKTLTPIGLNLDMSASDIVIATLFYQFSLYVCIRLARRGFTLGELGVVCNAATALFMESVNMTRMKVSA